MQLANFNQLSGRTKQTVVALIGVYGVLQLPELKAMWQPLAANHPHISSALAFAAVIYALVTNPVFQQMFPGFTTKTPSQAVTLPDGQKVAISTNVEPIQEKPTP